jgi:hypothetical protein
VRKVAEISKLMKNEVEDFKIESETKTNFEENQQIPASLNSQTSGIRE